MRILHVISSLAPALGGPSRACVEMAQAVAARGHAVEIAATDFGLEGKVPTDAAVASGAARIRYFKVGFPKTFKTSWPLARALGREIGGFDVVHLHSLYLFHDWAAARACRQAGVPYIVRPHGTLDPYIWRRHRLRKAAVEALFQRRVLRQAAAIHYTSADEMRLAASHAGPAPGRVVPLGFETAPFDDLPGPEAFLARVPAARGRRVVLFLGRLHEKKGLDLLVPAFARVAATRPDLHLAIVGPDDGMAAPVARWIAEHALEARASVVGMAEGEVKLSAFAAATVFALPSYSENFGIAALEALASGVPVVLSDQVNIWSEIPAYVCRTTVESVAERLAEVLDDPARARAVAEDGRRVARERYAWPRVAEALERLYAEVARAST